VGAVGPDGAGGGERRADEEGRRAMPFAVRLELVGRREEVGVDGLEGEERVGHHGRHGGGVRGREGVDAVAEGVEAVHVEREAGRRLVAAPAAQVLGRGGEAADGADAWRGADAALAAGDDEHGAVVAFDQRAGDQAHHAGVPGVVGDDDRRRIGVDLRQGALQHGVLDAAPFAVVVVEAGGDRERPLLVRDAEQFERQFRLAEAAGSVEARREAERHVPGGRRLPQARQRQRRADARPRRVGEALEPEPDQGAVLAEEGRDVGDRADRRQVGELDRVGEPEAAVHRPEQVVGDAGAGELGQPAAGQRRALRVDDERVGLALARRVVVADDHLDAGRLQRGDLGEVGDPAVDGDEQVGRGRVLRHPVGVDAVAVSDAVRDEGRHLRAQGAQPEREHRRAADAVGVVVAVDADASPAFDGVDEPVGGGGQVGDGGGRERGVEVLGDVVAQAAGPQDRGELWVDVQGRREPQGGRGRRGLPHAPPQGSARAWGAGVRGGRGARRRLHR
jgi:hypothetical protein